MEVSSKKLAVVTGGDDTFTGDADTARLTDDVTRHVLSCA